MSCCPTTVGTYQHEPLKKALVHGGKVPGCDHKAPMRHHMQKPSKTIDCLCKTIESHQKLLTPLHTLDNSGLFSHLF